MAEEVLSDLQRALEEVPREHFISVHAGAHPPEEPELIAPEGQAAPTLEVIQTMLQALDLNPLSRVLEVGTGTGYITALLSRLSAQVYTIEQIESVAGRARQRFALHGYDNIQLRVGDGYEGWPEHAPFDAILISAPMARRTETLRQQLALSGRMVVPVGLSRQQQTLVLVTHEGPNEYAEEQLGKLRFTRRLGDLLVDLGAADREQVEHAASVARAAGLRLGEVLLQGMKIEETDIYRGLALQRGFRFGTAEAVLRQADPALARQVPRAFLEHNRVLPVSRTAAGLILATCNPDAPVDDIASAFPRSPLLVCLVTPTDYRRLWAALDLGAQGAPSSRTVPPEAVPDLLAPRRDGEARYVGLFESLVLDAVAGRASDLHLERYHQRVRVRLRVDGELRPLERYHLSPDDLAGLINVIKVMAALDITERRRPQGGRIQLRAGGRVYDLRVQTQPALHGEHATVRLLPQNVHVPAIEDLGFPGALAAEYRRLLHSPWGLVLITGPTGAGKTTTLYAGLRILAHDGRRKIITVEDPIEYAIDDIQQTQVHPDIGFTFASAVRSFVRQDPNVILIGEIRDPETALEAVRASQTGHLVLSTLHCNDATDAVQRLFDLGVQANSLASELLAVVSQRLARRICEGCREPAAPAPEVMAELFPGGAPEEFLCYHGVGCSRCEGQGTRGRIAVTEFLRVGPDLRDALSQRLPVGELRRQAVRAGLHAHRESALDLVQRGVIALAELPRILSPEQMAPTPPGR